MTPTQLPKFWRTRVAHLLKSACPGARVFGIFIIVLWYAAVSPAHAQTPTPLPHFNLQLTTTRGCLETGQNPVYVVGESITVAFRVGSSTVPQATATLFDILSDGRVGVISFGTIATNQTRSFVAGVAPPTGVEQLLLRANAPGVLTTQRSCSFIVALAPPPGTTMTPTATGTAMTPAATATPTPLLATRTATTTRTPQPHLDLDLTTTRGCLETGQHPVYVIGESITVTFRIGSDAVSHATATVFDILSDGRVGVIPFGETATNETHSFAARIGPPTGIEQLLLRASAPGVLTTQQSCSFVVAIGVPPVQTATPTATATPSFATTPGAALSAHIHTDRGCIETGDDPVFAIGEPILISFRISSAVLPEALATLVDRLPNGFANTFSLGLVPTNTTLPLRGRITPPTGIEALQLNARSGSQTAVDTCSFKVVGAAPPPATKTRTPTPTATATATATPS